MKALFEEQEKQLIIGREGDKLTIQSVDELGAVTDFSFPLAEANKLQGFIEKMNGEIEDEQEGAKSFWKRQLM